MLGLNVSKCCETDSCKVVYWISSTSRPPLIAILDNLNFPMISSGTKCQLLSPGVLCNVCGLDDTDSHLFTCPGYSDIVGGQFNYHSFWDTNILEDTDKLKMLAKTVVLLLQRMKHVQNFDSGGDLSVCSG